jgi:hypothetical protein
VTSQGSPYVRFRRALDTGNATIALAAAAELDFVSLPDALELVLLLVHSRAPMLASRKPRPCSRVSPAWRAGDRKRPRARSPSSATGAGSSGRARR